MFMKSRMSYSIGSSFLDDLSCFGAMSIFCFVLLFISGYTITIPIDNWQCWMGISNRKERLSVTQFYNIVNKKTAGVKPTTSGTRGMCTNRCLCQYYVSVTRQILYQSTKVLKIFIHHHKVKSSDTILSKHRKLDESLRRGFCGGFFRAVLLRGSFADGDHLQDVKKEAWNHQMNVRVLSSSLRSKMKINASC